MSKLGPHLVLGSRNGYGDLLVAIANSPTANRIVVKAVDDFSPCREAKQLLGDRVLTVGRRRASDNLLNPNDTAEHNAQVWWDSMVPVLDSEPLLDVIESYNEIHSAWVLQADISNILVPRMAQTYQKRMCVWNLSSGTPQYPENDSGEQYSAILRSCGILYQYGGFVGLHEYGEVGNPNSPWMRDNAPHHATRYRRLATWLRERGPLPQFLISECAPGGGYDWGGNVDAWMSDLAWYDSELIKDPYVIGCCIFTLGNWEGHNSNYQDALPALTQHIITHPHQEPPTMPSDPRTPYTSRIILVHRQTFRHEELYKVAEEFEHTATMSPDDAGRGHTLTGLTREIWVANVPDWKPDDIVAWLNTNYPGAHIAALDVTPESLKAWLATNQPVGPWPLKPPTIQPPPTQPFKLGHPMPSIPLVITHPFGEPRDYGLHEGIDLRAVDSVGNPVPVVACADGVVEQDVDVLSGAYGKAVVLRHDWPDGNVYKTWYAHLTSNDVSIGQRVTKGQRIGLSGTTGNSTGIHLHLNLQWMGHGLSGYVVPDVVDPAPYLSVTPPPPTGKYTGLYGLNGDTHGGEFKPQEWEVVERAGLTIAQGNPKGCYLWFQPTIEATWERLHNNGQGIDFGNQFRRLDFAIDMRHPAHFYVNGWTNMGIWDLPIQESNIAGTPQNPTRSIGGEFCGNEPNIPQEGLGVAWVNADEFCQLLAEILDRIHSFYDAQFPNLKLIAPPMSPQPNELEWLDAMARYHIFEKCHYAAAHSYWYSRNHSTWPMESEAGGRGYRKYFPYLRYLNNGTGGKLIISEVSCNKATDPDDQKGRDYADWLAGVESDKVHAVMFFVCKGGPEFDAVRETWTRPSGITAIPGAFRTRWNAL